jgi:hypothetical protein
MARCSNGHENPVANRFCGRCGVPLNRGRSDTNSAAIGWSESAQPGPPVRMTLAEKIASERASTSTTVVDAVLATPPPHVEAPQPAVAHRDQVLDAGRLRHPVLLAGSLVAGCVLFLGLVSVEAYAFSPDYRKNKLAFLARNATPYYRYVRHLSGSAIIIGAIVTAFVLAVSWITPRFLARCERVTVASWFVGGIILQLLVSHVAPGPYSIRNTVVNDDFNWVARRLDVTGLLQQWDAIGGRVGRVEGQIFLRREHVHLAANMPGKALLYRLLRDVTTSPDNLGLAIVVISSIGALLVYYIAQQLFARRVTALYAMILYLVLPSRIVLLPFLNTITPVFVLALMAMLVAWFRSRHWGMLLGFGVVLYMAVLFEPAPLVAGPVFVALILREAMLSRFSRRDYAVMLLVPAGFFLAHVFMLAVPSFDIIHELSRVADDSARFNSGSHRGHAEFLAQNLREFFVQAGLVLSLLALGVVIKNLFVIASVRTRQAARRIMTNASAAIGFGLVATLIVLEALGTNRGETTRLWIFLAALLPFVIADVCTRGPRWLFSVVLGCTLAQAFVVANVFATYPNPYVANRVPSWDGAFLVDLYALAVLGGIAVGASLSHRRRALA